MKIESIFQKYFFISFLIGILISFILILFLLGIYANNYYDKSSMRNIMNLEKNYEESKIKSANIKLTSLLLKYQVHINELILFYQDIAEDLLKDENSHQLENGFLISAVSITFLHCFFYSRYTDTMALWILDSYATNSNIGRINEVAKKQLISFSHLVVNLDTIFRISSPETYSYFFYFEETELYITYPLALECNTFNVFYLKKYPYSERYKCLDENGFFHTSYKLKCESFFQNMMKSKTKTFDNNYLSNQNRTIFINNFNFTRNLDYYQEFSMCIQFEDPITNGKAYGCVSTIYSDLAEPLDNLNKNIKGYFFVSNIGLNNVFYYPNSYSTGKISSEYIFRWDSNYAVDEKQDFYNIIEKTFTSNYIEYIGDIEFEEIFVNGKNSSTQYFYRDGELFNYSIYPITLSNINGKKEHIFSIIYIYDNNMLLGSLYQNFFSLAIKMILSVFIFLIFCLGLIYLIYLAINHLSKDIVIPIKNVNYMLKGINIGGENRLKYLDFLSKKQDESLEKLENMFLLRNNKNKKGNNELINNNEIENLNEHFDKNINYNKEYYEESRYIENENNFYNFDEQLLQFRSLEIESLIKSLLDLKSAFILTSEDRQVNEIIDYSFSEEIFNKIKNKEGSIICESNIGNLQGQQMEYDKAIYHLALSLLDTKLKRFLKANISDELDDSDFLLNKIYYSFSTSNLKKKANKLQVKQMNSMNESFSQKDIGILINTRYCRLVHYYYIFFKNLRKLNKLNDNKIQEQFMSTTFHTLNYYHKILIQYIFLSYAKNDLVKIGESILNYLEFLIKFKFKISEEEKDTLEMNNRDNPEFIAKQNYKKKIFEKILDWFFLFDEYISYVKNNSSLDDIKSFLDVYSKSLNSENNDFNCENQSILLFRINIQKYDFLKAKFSLACGNYIDALFYFIRASKKNSIVIDGLIKKRSLKGIYKLLMKMKIRYNEPSLRDLYMEKEIKEYFETKNKIYNKKYRLGRKAAFRIRKSNNINSVTFGEEIENIKKNILFDFDECNSKGSKDIIVLIDLNIYNTNYEENIYLKNYKIDSFIEQTQLILNSYLSNNDRFCVLMYTDDYKIVCPLMKVNKIDINSFSKDLINYKNMIMNENNETDEYDININEFDEENDNLDDFNIGENNSNEFISIEGSSEISEQEEQNYDKVNILVNIINYVNSYSKIKEGEKNEKYIILFSDIINVNFKDEEELEKNMEDLIGDKNIIFLLIGKTKKNNLNNENNDIILENLIVKKFGVKSEIIEFENMKKIKTILSNNNVIKDEILYPNEIYK